MSSRKPSFRALSEVAAARGATARIAFRVNPDVDAKTHHKIATGKAENKFGVPFDEAPSLYALASRLPGIEPTGVHMHIGSQITELAPFRNAFALLQELVARSARARASPSPSSISAAGSAFPIATISRRRRLPADYARLVQEEVGGLGLRLLFEPGRMIAGNAGILVARVLYVKRGASKTFTIVDAAMNDLMRPTLYEAYHEILPVDRARARHAGRSSPTWRDRCARPATILRWRGRLPELKAGDLISVMTAGAYGAVLASEYNSQAAGARGASRREPL